MFERVALAIDRGDAGRMATSFAVSLAGNGNTPGSVRVVHINEFLFGGRGHTVETQAEAAAVVQEAVDELRAAGVEATGEVRLATCFNTAAAIADAAAEWGADVIVVGSRRHPRLGALFSRGVRGRITRMTPLPVVAAPAPITLGRGRVALDRIPADLGRNPSTVGS
jgi:nucleotide-binding universal stress UspA family protein